MSVNAREAIMNSFMKLAAKKSVDKITVKDIVEDCGVNRNTFYYHFEDLPNLIKVTIDEQLGDILASQTTPITPEEGLGLMTDFIKANKDVCMNIRISKHADLLERNLLNVCEKCTTTYFNMMIFNDVPVSESDQQMIIYFYKCLIYGVLVDWINANMRYDVTARFKRIAYLREGGYKSMIERSRKDAGKMPR